MFFCCLSVNSLTNRRSKYILIVTSLKLRTTQGIIQESCNGSHEKMWLTFCVSHLFNKTNSNSVLRPNVMKVAPQIKSICLTHVLVNCPRCSKRSCYHLVRKSITQCSLQQYVTPRCTQMAVVVPRVDGVGAAGRTDRILSLVWSSAAPNLSLLHVQEVWTGSCWFLWTDPPHLLWNTESIWKVCQPCKIRPHHRRKWSDYTNRV